MAGMEGGREIDVERQRKEPFKEQRERLDKMPVGGVFGRNGT